MTLFWIGLAIGLLSAAALFQAVEMLITHKENKLKRRKDKEWFDKEYGGVAECDRVSRR